MKDKLEIKVFWQDVKLSTDAIAGFLARAQRNLGILIKASAPAEFPLVKVPDGYDLYILHLGDLAGNDYKHIRERNEYRIVGIDNGGHYLLRIEVDQSDFDRIYGLRTDFGPEKIEEELRITKEKIEKGEI